VKHQHALSRAALSAAVAAVLFILLFLMSPIPDTPEKKQEYNQQIEETIPGSWMNSLRASYPDMVERFSDPFPEKAEKLLMAAVFALLAGGILYFASKFIKDPAAFGFFIAALAAGMIIRTVSLTQINNSDYLFCLAPWAEGFRNHGWSYIVTTWSDYNVTYLYIIGGIARIPLNDLYLYKLVSVIFDCGIVIAGLRLANVFHFGPLRKAVLGGALFLAPTVWLNSSFWGQCDSIYVFFCLLGLVFILEDRPALSAVCAAAAFSFKMQAIFILPIFAVLWMVKRVKWWREIPVFLGTYFITVIPAWLIGRPLFDILLIYFNQTQTYSSRLNLNSPSAYALLGPDTSNLSASTHDILFKTGLVLAFCFLGALLLIAWVFRDRIGSRAIFLFALTMVIGIPWLLPSMHDRYFYLADIFCVILAVMIPKRWYFAPFCIIASYSGYHAYLFWTYIFVNGHQIPALIMLYLMGSAVVVLISELKGAKTHGNGQETAGLHHVGDRGANDFFAHDIQQAVPADAWDTADEGRPAGDGSGGI
jgi:Gpi18-like mannosyltransferase